MKFVLRGFYPTEREELQKDLNDIEDGANHAGIELSGTIAEEALHQRGKYVSAEMEDDGNCRIRPRWGSGK